MIGQTVGKYHVVDKIGEGGMGTVWKAEDPTLGRLVALKALSASLADDEEARERFVREARAASALNHPNIATVYELLEDDDRHFIVMEYVEGKTIRDMAETGTVSVKKALDLFTQAAEALEAAHSKGILHRDVKSANIMVTMEGRVKVMDFGLASLEKHSHLTRTGTTLGTLAYSSPEQITGRPLDARSEIFALGVVFYELLSGKLPFKDTTEGELVFAIINNEPPALDTLRNDLPADLVNIVRRMLQKDPADRYASCHEVATDLRTVRRGFETTTTTITAVAVSTGRAWWKPGLAVAAVALLAWAGIATFGGRAKADAIRIAVLPFEFRGEGADEAFADGLTESVMNRLTGVAGLDVLSSRSTFSYRDQTKSLSEIGRELDADFILTGTLRETGSNGGGDRRIQLSAELVRASDESRVWSDLVDEAYSNVMALEGTIAEGVVGPMGIRMAGGVAEDLNDRLTENADAYAAYMKGRSMGLVSTEAEMNQEIRFYSLAIDLDPAFAEAYAGLARAHALLVNWGYDRSPQRVEQGRQAADRALELDPKSPLVLRDVAWFHYHGQRDLERAFGEFQQAEKGLPGDVDIIRGKAYVMRRMGRMEEALAGQIRAVELDPTDLYQVADVGGTLYALGRYEEAVTYLERGGAAYTDGEQVPVYHSAVLNLTGDLTEAEKVLDRWDRVSPGSSDWYWALQWAYEGRLAEAVDRLGKIAEPYVENQWNLLVPATEQGILLLRMGRADQARQAFTKARDILVPGAARNDTDPRYHAALGIAYAGLGEESEALKEGERALSLMPASRDRWENQQYQFDNAIINLLLGRHEQAVGFLTAFRDVVPGTWTAEVARFDPLWAPVRDLPSFKRLYK